MSVLTRTAPTGAPRLKLEPTGASRTLLDGGGGHLHPAGGQGTARGVGGRALAVAV